MAKDPLRIIEAIQKPNYAPDFTSYLEPYRLQRIT